MASALPRVWKIKTLIDTVAIEDNVTNLTLCCTTRFETQVEPHGINLRVVGKLWTRFINEIYKMENELLDSYEIDENRYGVDDGLNNNELTGVENTAALGVDDNEEVVVKKRKVMPKLDSDRLLSDKGIPQLRTKVIPSIKLKGRGHERGDIRRILYSYQMWAHTLFPKAKFEDFIELARKAGKEPSMKVHRRQWIDHEKYGYDFSAVSRDIGSLDSSAGGVRSPEYENGQTNGAEPHVQQNSPSEGENDLFMGGMDGMGFDDEDLPVVAPKHNNTSRQRVFGDDEDDDDLYDKPTEAPNKSTNGASTTNNDNNDSDDDGIPQDDEIEELMASRNNNPTKENGNQPPTDDHEDPGDADLEEVMHDTSSANNQDNLQNPDKDDDFEADAMAAAGELGF